MLFSSHVAQAKSQGEHTLGPIPLFESSKNPSLQVLRQVLLKAKNAWFVPFKSQTVQFVEIPLHS